MNDDTSRGSDDHKIVEEAIDVDADVKSECQNSQDNDIEIMPVISIPETSINNQSDNNDDNGDNNKNVIAILPDDSAEFLETEDNYVEIKHRDVDIDDEEFMKVKQELCEVNQDEVTGYF